MNCRRARRALGDRLSDRLGARQADELSQHLGACSRCRELEAELVRLDERMRAGLPDVEPDPRLRGRVLESWRTGQTGERWGAARRLGRVAVWATATAAAALLVVTLKNQIRAIQKSPVSVRLELPEGTVLAREPEFVVVKAVDR